MTSSWQQFGPVAGKIFLQVILPLLPVVALGALVQRWRPMNLPTLSKLNIYIFVPAFLFIYVYESKLTWNQLGSSAGIVFLAMAALGLPLFAILRARGVTGTTLSAIILGSLIFNAGNFGLPVAQLVHGTPETGFPGGLGMLFPGQQSAEDGPAVQAVVVVVSNLSIWFVGYLVIALSKGQGWRGVLGYFQLPMIYVLVAALILKWVRQTYNGGTDVLPTWAMASLRPVAQAVVPLGLITLGAQLAVEMRRPRWKIVGPVVLLKLAVLPLVTFVICWACGLWPWPGAQIILGIAAPTAVNTLLITIELEGDADLAASCVFWTTLFSAVTVTVVLAMLAVAGGATIG